MSTNAEVLADEVIYAHALINAAKRFHLPSQLPTAPDGYLICGTCDKGPEPGRHVRWPCPTALALDPDLEPTP